MTEEAIRAVLARGEIQLSPLSVVEVPSRAEGEGSEHDPRLTLGWNGRLYRFVVACKRLWTPKAISAAISEIRQKARPPQLYPLIVVPYLSEEHLSRLEGEKVSGIDLCGNGVVVVAGELLVFRTGQPNRFRWESAIKNVYRRNSSVVARVFLIVPEFGSIQGALSEIWRRDGEVTLATVSKVCSALDEDLIVERGRGATRTARKLRLLQPEKLLDLLTQNYEPPEIKDSVARKWGSSFVAAGFLLRFLLPESGEASHGTRALYPRPQRGHHSCGRSATTSPAIPLAQLSPAALPLVWPDGVSQ